jgi:hypothetical protein
MSERIKEMWEEATVSMWPRPGKFTAGEYDYHLEKFAELIVKQTMQVVANQLPSNQYLDVANAVIEHYKDH